MRLRFGARELERRLERLFLRFPYAILIVEVGFPLRVALILDSKRARSALAGLLRLRSILLGLIAASPAAAAYGMADLAR